MSFFRSFALISGFFAVFSTASVAKPAEPAATFDPASLREHVQGPPTRVFVLGTPHLAAFQTLDARELEPLLERLAAFAPSVIAVESLPAETLFVLDAFEGDYPGVALDFGKLHRRLAEAAKAETGLSPPAAQAAARRLVAGLGSTPSSADRRRLAATFAAAYDPPSALVQWLRLRPEERRAGDGVSPDLAKALDQYAGRRNETVIVAAELAVRLGLDRLHAADDQTDADLVLSRLAELEAQWPKISAALNNPDSDRVRETTARAGEPGELFEAYRALNAPETGLADIHGQWRAYLKADLDGDLGRRRLIQWEVRNFRMAAHLREATADAPGSRVLMIVGASHKPWLDRYLAQMHDVEVVRAEEVLGRAER